ncbi:MAG: Nif11-like leader peptide family natural product precursor [Ruminiclostridium sp.]|nr:Nif11-like leader peptide family natural product precursor [Ruminiclostridium sp.]
MSNEKVTKLVKELQENAALREKVTSMSSPEEMLKFANDSGYDVTMEDLMEVEKALREAKAEETDEVVLSFDDIEDVAGGYEEAPDGHDIGCVGCYHHYDWQKEHNIWCTQQYYCIDQHWGKSIY